VWSATFELARCAIELFRAGGLRHDLARFGVGRASAISQQADLMLAADRTARNCAGTAAEP
jgi:NADH-quinone oxidoreductase subunit B